MAHSDTNAGALAHWCGQRVIERATPNPSEGDAYHGNKGIVSSHIQQVIRRDVVEEGAE